MQDIAAETTGQSSIHIIRIYLQYTHILYNNNLFVMIPVNDAFDDQLLPRVLNAS